MEAIVYNAQGVETGKISLPDALFAREVHTGLIHRLLVLQQANGRIAIAHTKTRGERNGSTRKLYKQKHTGNARAGDARSPTRRGGGVAFGPTNARNFSVSMNKKERRLALFSILSSKAGNAQIKVIESFEQDAQKTKEMKKVISNMNLNSAVFALLPEDKHAFLGARNIPSVKAIGVNYLNPADLLKFKELVFTKSSLEKLADIYS